MPLTHRDYHRFLWRSHPSDPIQVYRWKSHVFGNAGSPCVAIFAIKEHARKFRQQYPDAAETIISSTLVDDNLDSRNSEDEALKVLSQLRQLLSLMDMNIKKIVSNSSRVMQNTPEDERSKSLKLADFCVKDAVLPIVKALGVIYLADEDCFSFSMEAPPSRKSWTRRYILRYQARLYDPHGLVLPFTIEARMILQRSWRAANGWDDPLPEELQKQWTQWLLHLTALPKLRIPRCVHPTSIIPQYQHLHIFCDASTDAYAAVAYLVSYYPSSPPISRLLVARAKVAPLRQVSVPRLELMAAELALQVAMCAGPALQIPQKDTFFWSDSTNVLCWIKNDSRTLTSFVGTRVAKIQHHTVLNNWAWVDSAQNPADIPSRGMGAGQLAITPLWWEGPEFLVIGRPPPPPEAIRATEEAVREVKRSQQFLFISDPITYHITDAARQDLFPFHRFSTWNRMIRVIAQCKRWPHPQMKGDIKTQEIKEAKRVAIILIQAETFGRTTEELRRNNNVTKQSSSHLSKLRPSLHPDGLIRATARLSHLHQLPYENRFPIILPKSHPAVDMLILDVHRTLLHAGPDATLAELMKEYWLIQGRATVRKVLTRCIICRRQKPKHIQPSTAPLPVERLNTEKGELPFLKVGIDMAGPFLTTNNKKIHIHKRYFLLITCLSSRAVHLEYLASASTESFILAFLRFINRRLGGSPPNYVICDNGTNLVGGKKQFTTEFEKRIGRSFIHTKWEFIPPTGSHFGGVYERLIKAVKKSLYHAIPQDSLFSDEEFNTALITVEAILNNRPLSYVSTDPESPTPLTPAHLLGSYPIISPAPFPGKTWTTQRRWHYVQARMETFWKRFRSEVIPFLQLSTKWNKKSKPIQIGDVVTLLDDQARGKWPIAKVVEIEEGHDGVVRVVTVKIPGLVPTFKRRPVIQLGVLLPADEQ